MQSGAEYTLGQFHFKVISSFHINTKLSRHSDIVQNTVFNMIISDWAYIIIPHRISILFFICLIFTSQMLPSILASTFAYTFSTHNVLTPIVLSMFHYSDVIMGAIASETTSLIIVYSTVYSGADVSFKRIRKKIDRVLTAPHSAGSCMMAHWWVTDSPHKGPIIQKVCPYHDIVTHVGSTIRYNCDTNLPITK